MAKLDGEVQCLNDQMEVWTLENTGLSKPKAESEADLVGESAVKRVLEKDILLILRDKLSRVVDRVIESP